MLDLRNCDNMELMKQYPNNYFDLAICDPPYGIKADVTQQGLANKKGFTEGAGTYREYHKTDWDNAIPTDEYFTELKRVSKEQIIWGGNYFHNLHLTGVIVWNKKGSGNFKEGELAKTSINTFKVFNYSRADAYINDCKMKIHPTQKPVQLYNFLLLNYAKQGMKILDTHLGSGSIAIACHYFGCDLVGCEIDETYYKETMERIKIETAQLEISFNH
jgi:site-specific DNA-methyltransferase (adenine-specific)